MNDQDIYINIGDQIFRFGIDNQNHALYLSLGWTLAELQSFEMGMAVFLTTVVKFDDNRSHDEQFDYFLSNTLGKMVQILRPHIDDTEILKLLNEAREKRNYFVHRFLHHRWPFMKNDECADMVIELREMRDFFRHVHDTILIHLRDAKDIPIIGIKTDPVTGQPVEI